MTFNELQEQARELGIDLVNKKAGRDNLYHLVEEEMIIVTEGIVGQRGKKISFRVGVPHKVDPKTKEVEGLDLLNGDVTTPEELEDALGQIKK